MMFANMCWKRVTLRLLDLGIVVQACHLSYLGGRDWEDPSSRPTQAESSRDQISTDGWNWWHLPVIPAMQGSAKRKMTV
jgi:hypothetical protein